MRKYRLSLTDWLIVLIATPLVHLLGLTLRIQAVGRTDLGPRARQDEPPLWSVWHETILMSVWYHRHTGIHVMISASRDGELISTIGRFFGFTAARGSSSRGATGATRKMVEHLKAGKRCAITPDGPRGPRRKMKPGAVHIARMAGCPVVPFTFAAEHCWRLNSWDRFMVPRPFSRAVFVYGEPIRIPAEGGDDAVYLAMIQAEMDRISAVAEAHFQK